jgi:hypothetical protein
MTGWNKKKKDERPKGSKGNAEQERKQEAAQADRAEHPKRVELKRQGRRGRSAVPRNWPGAEPSFESASLTPLALANQNQLLQRKATPVPLFLVFQSPRRATKDILYSSSRRMSVARGFGARVPTLDHSDLQTHRHIRTWWNNRYTSFYLASFVILIMSLTPQHLLWLGELRSGRLEWA